MNKFVVLVIDSFGVGAMEDVPQVRPNDAGANTCGHILQQCPDLRLPAMERLGLINALGYRANVMGPNPQANVGKAALQHEGADSFMGHQEIMGTQPKQPFRMPFGEIMDKTAGALRKAGYRVQRLPVTANTAYLWVNDAVAVGDNLETDPGLVYNVTANLNQIDYDTVRKIGAIVRRCAPVSRVIVFGGESTSNEAIAAAAQSRQDMYAGIDAPRSGVYRQGFRVVHLGYGVDEAVQVPACLQRQGIPTSLIGKVADIVANPDGDNFGGIVDSAQIMALTLSEAQRPGRRFICTNIQETDLAGHAQDVARYAERLQLVDGYLAHLMSLLDKGDALVVMADHGNDPTIGHSQHTREGVPLLIWRQGVTGVRLGDRATLSDVGASVCDAFGAPAPQNGTSFFSLLQGNSHG